MTKSVQNRIFTAVFTSFNDIRHIKQNSGKILNYRTLNIGAICAPYFIQFPIPSPDIPDNALLFLPSIFPVKGVVRDLCRKSGICTGKFMDFRGENVVWDS